jgi:hypothetical protein
MLAEDEEEQVLMGSVVQNIGKSPMFPEYGMMS